MWWASNRAVDALFQMSFLFALLLPSFRYYHGPKVYAPTSKTASWLRDSVRLSGLVSKGDHIPNDNIFRMDLFEEAQKQL